MAGARTSGLWVAPAAFDSMQLASMLVHGGSLGQIDARPCASALIGRLRAVGSETRNAASESARPFWVVGGAAVLSAELPWLLEVSARVAVGANLVRDSFEFTPVVFHEVSAVTTAASLGIGLGWR